MASQNKHVQTYTFDHPELGPMIGLVSPEKVVQFRAIPYATLSARFKQSVLLDNLPGTNRDFTKRGFACPQTFPDRETDGGPFPGEARPPQSDEFKSHILQINVPLCILQKQSDEVKHLPVLVYIHGGGFVLGHIDEQHNTALMAEQSLSSDSSPIITASIQYRLGALGYLHTSESGNANLALHDQRNALLWIQKFIAGFNGDASRVTVFGESAGSMSICHHMLALPPPSGPLFNRAILMSGVPGPTCLPMPVDEAQKLHDRFLDALGITERGTEALEKLRDIEIDKIVGATAELTSEGAMWLPVLDEELFGENIESMTWDRIPEFIGKCEWVDSIVLGTTRFEGTTMTSMISGLTPTTFLNGIKDQVDAQSAEKIAQSYNVTPTMDQNLFLTAATRWIGDVVFDSPTHALAQHLSTKTNKNVYRYIFDVRNPFIGHTLYQLPHHWVDIYFVFKTFQFRYPTQKLKDISTQHAQLWVDFANSKQPWSKYKYTGRGDETIMVADEREGWVERSVKEDEKLHEESWKRLEELRESWKKMAGKHFSPLKMKPMGDRKLV